MNILIATSEMSTETALRHGFEGLGHAVAIEADSLSAWERIATGEHRLVIADLSAPGVDGLDLCRRIRARDNAPYIYVILLTDKSSSEDRNEGAKAGADDYLVKPIDPAELASHLEMARRILLMQEELRSTGTQLKKIHGKLDDRRRTQIGEILVDLELITAEQLRQALAKQKETPQRLGEVLMTNGWTDIEGITQARAVQMEVPYVRIADQTEDPFVNAMIPHETALRYHALAFAADDDHAGLSGRLRVAMVNPYDIEAIDLIQRQTRRRVEPYLASEGAMREAIDRAYNTARDDEHDAMMRDSISEAGIDILPPDDPMDEINTADLLEMSDHGPVIRFVNTLFMDAAHRRASDIHIEPRKNGFKILYRIDGQLREIRSAPTQFLAPTVSRIKIMAEMDISERRVPLDGRIAMRLDGRSIDMRVSTLPTQYGERVVMRVLDRATACRTFDQLGFSEHNKQGFERLIHRPHGIILVTGPTGSGKTTTLYAALNRMKEASEDRGINIITCEDPIEYELDGVNQSAVNERAGLTFARQLRAILRQDPDVILVGEIRDADTAEIAFRAALTGHLVLSTLHCNDAAGAITRLQDMGVPRFLIASSLIGVIAQRLVLKLCPYCRKANAPDEHEQRLFRDFAPTIEAPEIIYSAAGCPQCDKTGVRGRIAVHELMIPNREIQGQVKDGEDTQTIRETAIEAGMIPLIGDGLDKVSQGLASIEDILSRVNTGDQD